MQSPALGGAGGGVSASRLVVTPTPSSAAMHRVTSTGSRTGQKKHRDAKPGGVVPGTEPTSRRSSSEEISQRRLVRPSRPSLESITHSSHETQSLISQGYPATSTATAHHRQARLQSPLSLQAAQATDTRDERGQRRTYEREGDDMRGYIQDAAEPASPAALSDSSSSSSSTPSEPVMSRIFKRPPGHALPSQRKSQRQQRGGDHGYRTVGLGISPGASDDYKVANDDDDDESEPQAAFLRIKTPTNVAKAAASAGGGSDSGRPSQHRLHQQSTRLQHRRSNTGDSSSASSSTSASPTAKVFKAQTVAAATAAAAGGNPGSATSASAMAAARLQSSRGPGIRSPPHLQNYASGRSPAVLAVRAAGISREGSETGTTPSIGSSFSDLDSTFLLSFLPIRTLSLDSNSCRRRFIHAVGP